MPIVTLFKFMWVERYFILAGLLLLYMGYLKIEVAELKKDKAQLEANYTVIKSGADQCTAKVTELQNNTNILTNNLATAATSSAAGQKASAVAIQAILNQQVPKDCEGAIKDLGAKLQIMNNKWRIK